MYYKLIHKTIIKMLQEESKPAVYRISFTLEEIRPLIIRNIDISQDPNSVNSLWNLKDYKYYHEQLKDYYLQIDKQKKPSMSDKLAYIVLLSNSKRKILDSESIEDFKLFREDREADFKINQVIEAEYNENDEDHEDHNDCICSYQNLKTVYYVENVHTGIVLHVGSECIKKYKLVSKEEFESKKKNFKEIMSKKKERQLEVEQGLPLGYFEEQRQLEKKKKEEQRQVEKRKKEEEKMKKKIDTGNYKMCYLCNNSLVNIKNDRNKRFCNSCIEEYDKQIIKKSLIDYLKSNCERLDCSNCDIPFISLLSENEYLCKKCVKEHKIISCKICKTNVLLEIYSTDTYCEDCEKKLINCIDCKETFIKNNNNNRCQTCQICYENKVIIQKCIGCYEDFPVKQKEKWRTTCSNCYINKKNNNISKICKNCDEEFEINPNESWKTICRDCYKKSMNKSNCINCENEFKKLETEQWKTMCYDCYKYFKNL